MSEATGEPHTLPLFTAIGASGSRITLMLTGWKNERPCLATIGCASYLADLTTGVCDDDRGYRLVLTPNALRRLRRLRQKGETT